MPCCYYFCTTSHLLGVAAWPPCTCLRLQHASPCVVRLHITYTVLKVHGLELGQDVVVTQSHSMHAIWLMNVSTGYLVIVSLEVLYLDSVFIMVRDVMTQNVYGTVVFCQGSYKGAVPQLYFWSRNRHVYLNGFAAKHPTSHEICQNWVPWN